MSTATINAERARKINWRIRSENILMYLLMLLVLFALVLMLAWGASVMNP